MLGYALDDQLLHADLFVRIFGLIPILKNGFLGIFIDSGINLQCAFAVAGKGNNDIANLSIAICPDNDQISAIDTRINHGITGSLQNIVLAIPEKGNRKADIFHGCFLPLSARNHMEWIQREDRGQNREQIS